MSGISVRRFASEAASTTFVSSLMAARLMGKSAVRLIGLRMLIACSVEMALARAPPQSSAALKT